LPDFSLILVALLVVVAILVAGGVFVSRYIFVLLAVFVLIFVWAVFVPIQVPVPPFHSALLDHLEQSNAKIRETKKDNITTNSEDLAPFFPSHPTLEEAEGVLRKEGFSCGPLQGWNEKEIARWGQEFRRFKICTRLRYFHPLASFGWEIYLFASEADTVESMMARRYYDGL
jgi:hypothetical protein